MVTNGYEKAGTLKPKQRPCQHFEDGYRSTRIAETMLKSNAAAEDGKTCSHKRGATG
jgi:hypothetical protein